MFGQALYRSGRYDVEEVERGITYHVRHVEAEKREKWCREMHVVSVHEVQALLRSSVLHMGGARGVQC